MSQKYTQLMGKTKDPIFKFKPVNIKQFSKKLEESLKQKSQQSREAELKRKSNFPKLNQNKRNRSLDSHKSQSPIKESFPQSPTKTISYSYSVEPSPPMTLEIHEKRERKEHLEVLKLIKQYYDISFHPFHKYYETPYFKKPYSISCFEQFNEDTTNIDYLEQDYSNCYITPLLSIKNLGRYDCWEDLPPEVWMEKCMKNHEDVDSEYDGTSPMYDYANDKFLWNYVTVLSYDPAKLKYRVKFLHTEKDVSRLSLMFRWEDQNEFDYRKFLCEKRRARVDQFNLFTRYVDNVPTELVAPLNFDWQKKIESKVRFATKHLIEKYNAIFDEGSPSFQREITVVKQDFLRQMKKCRILLEMQEPQNKQKFKERSLEIRQFYKVIPTQSKGIVNHSAEFNKHFDFINKKSFFEDRKFIQDLLVSFLQLAEDMKGIDLILSNIDDTLLPLKIKDFNKLNENFLKKSRAALNNICSSGYSGLIRSFGKKDKSKDNEVKEVSVKYDYLVSTQEAYDKSLAKKVVIYYNLILKSKAKELVDNSIIAFMQYFKKFGKCNYDIADKNELIRSIDTHYPESNLPLFQTRVHLSKVDQKDKKKPNPTGARIKIVFKPSLEECKESLMGALTEIKKIISEEIKNLAPLCFKLVDVKDDKIFLLDDDYPLYKQAVDELNAIIDYSINEAELKRKEYEEFTEILEESSEMYVRNSVGGEKETKKNLDVTKCTEVLDRLNYFTNLLNSKETEINLRLFRISTEEIKQDINDKISEITKIMIDRMDGYCTDRTKELQDQNQEKIAVIQKEVQNIDEYKSLYDLLATIPDFVKVKKEELTNVGKILVIIESQKYESCKKAFDLFRKLVESWMIPSTISDASKRASEDLEVKKVDFLDDLKVFQQKFKEEIIDLEKKFDFLSKVDSFTQESTTGVKVSIQMQEFNDRLNEDREKRDRIKKEMKILHPEKAKEIDEGSEDLPEFEKLTTIYEDFQPYKILWNEYTNVMVEYENKVETKTLLELKELVPNADKKSTKEVFVYVKELEESRAKIEKIQKDHPYDTTLVQLVGQLKEKLEYYESFNWIIQTLNSACLKEDDWKEIRNTMQDTSIDSKCKLIDLKKKNIDNFRDVIELIKSKASRRAGFVQKYKEILSGYYGIIMEPRDERKIGLKKIDEVLILLDELSNNLVNIISNPVTQSDARLKNDTKSLNEKIKNVQIILEEVIKFQSNFLYLEPIFNTNEINKALAAEKADFMKVNTFWRGFMDLFEASAWELASFMEKENFTNLYKNLNDNNKNLQNIIRKLNEYLNMKRTEFPRFYFVSDEDLLRILAQSKNPLLVQPHLSKCFEGINHVVFNNSNTVIQKMISSKDECIPLLNEINVVDDRCRGNVEVWLGMLEESMRNTMKDLSRKCLDDLSKKKRIDWIKDMEWPGQLVQIIDQISWTSGVENGVINNTLQDFFNVLTDELQDVVNLVRTTIPALLSITLSGLIVISVHNKDIVEKMLREKIDKITDFEWKAQMRYYYHQEKDDDGNRRKKKEEVCPITVSMITTELNYGFEYLGNITRLVITPLTDRCFRTLFGAYNVKYGGAPEGPAGTGKTESVKDLSKCVGVMCNVFNCTEGIKIQGMSKFFKGLASSGCWCCFDEFNRIDTEVLSVIAQQILTIQNALKAKLNYFYFEENEKILIKDTCAINITMNPSYSGRNELPDNLKALFRPCAMMVADYNLIAQIKLYSFGFKDANTLCYKIVSSLKLSSEQLSTQSHYDFGMRSLNAILVAAGKEKKKHPDLEEGPIAKRALIDVNLPKFTSNDTPLFESLVEDLFPGTKPLESDMTLLDKEVRAVAESFNLQSTDNFVKKCIQLHETMNVRHALMIVGKAGMGKSKVIVTLKTAITNLPKEAGFNKVETITLNPKSILQKQLYGYFDSTQEWKKGLLQVKMTDLCEKEKAVFKWLIFDGPVDTLWIENMNSLLDDNKKLCLEDSSSIYLADNMNIVFEVDDLKEASPATVSRNGMVLCEQDTISTDDLILSYYNTLPEQHFNPKLRNQFKDNAIWITNTALEYVNKDNVEFGLPCDKFHLVHNFLTVFDCYMKDYKNPDEIISKERELNQDKIDNLLISSVILGILGPVKKDRKLQDFLNDMCLGNDVNKDYKLNFNSEFSTNRYNWEPKRLSTQIHQIENIFEMVYILETGKWYKWLEMPNRKEFKVTEELKFNELVIPTPDTLKMSWLISMVVPIKKHLLFTGPTGTGKTLTIISTLMANYDNDMYSYVKMSMTAQTTANFTQEIIEKKLQKSYRKFSPHQGKKGVIFVDDLNMPQKEKYGAQPPIELLRQWMDFGGWYDLLSDTKDFVNVIDISFLASMGSVASGRTVSSRYLRHYLIHYADNYSKETMQDIYRSIIQWFFIRTKQPQFTDKIVQFKEPLINATVQMYQEVSSTFKATPAKTHYQFNLRDISRVFLGISRANARTVRDENDMISLWIHECERIFKDRLVNENDRDLYEEIVSRVMKTSMRRENSFANKNILWGDYVKMIFIDDDPKKGAIDHQYCELKDEKLLQKTLEDKLYEYNHEMGNRSESAGPLHLVLFHYAIEHLSRILRIISTYNGNAVLVGVGGSGRKSLTVLSTFIYGFGLRQTEGDWTDSLKTMMRELGNKEIVFLVSDTQIEDKQIEDLNNMLNNGEVPNLIDQQDLQVIKDNIPTEYTQGKKLQNDQEVMAAFIENCKAKIHIVLCMSPIGESFRKRILMFPSLVSCTTIDWFLPWPEEALSSVAQFYLNDVKEIDTTIFNQIVSICVDMQSRVISYSNRYFQELRRHNYVTPMSFIELLNLFKNLLQQRTVEIRNEIQRYGNGLIVLAESEKTAKEMGDYIKELEPQLKQQQELTNKQLIALNELKEQLDKDEKIGMEKEAEAKIVKAEAEKQNKIANERAAHMEAKKKDAESTLNEIKPDDVLQIKKYKVDPSLMKFSYFLCMLVLKNPHPKPKPAENPKDPPVMNYFEHACKNVLNKSGGELLKFLKKFDSTKMPHDQMVELKEKLDNLTKEEFDPEKKSLAMANIFKVIGIHNDIFFLNEEYVPLKRTAEECERKLKEAEDSLREIQENLERTLKTKEEKEKELNEAKALIEQLEKKKNQCNTRLKNATILNSNLGNEKEEWKRKKENLEEFSVNIIGDILISSGIISYLGAFTKAYREEIILHWANKIRDSKIPISYSDTKSPNDIMRSIIGDDMEIETWKSQKLPNDNFSTDNALIMSKSRRFCLLIDPQNQALQWLKEKIKMETELKAQTEKKDNKRHDDHHSQKKEKRKDGGTGAHYTIKPTMDNKTMLDVTLDCVQNGRSLIYENAGEVLAQVIAPIYKKEFYSMGKQTFVSINGQQYEVNDNFRFYIITQLPKPHYLPDVCVALTLVNFTVTEEGLQDQMLNYLVEKEDPTLNSLRKNCIDTRNTSERKKKEIERDILFQLDESKKSTTEDYTILDNEKLIEKLRQSNQTSVAMAQTLIKQKETENKISAKRNFLAPVSVHVAQLFFTVCDLSNIEPVYQYSLKFYQDIFGLAIDSTPKEPKDPKDPNPPKETDEAERLEKLKLNFNSILYDKICMSLFEKDKLVFSFLMQTKLQMIPYTQEQKNNFNKEIRFLVTGGSGKEATIPNPAENDADSWISKVQWNSLCELAQTLEAFKGLEQSFIDNITEWKKVISLSSNPFGETYPKPFDTLNDFYKMIILRILRQDKTVPALKQYITDSIGDKYVVSPSFDIGKAYDESKNRTPILFIISPGADPLILIDKLCKREGKSLDDNVKTLSLGQGQEKAAIDAIDKAQIRDQEKWILLQNCHLAKSFMNMLEKKIEEIVETGSSFRLFLTALPSKVIPISIIQDSIKIVNEPPRGLKQSIQRTFSTVDETTYDKCEKTALFRRFAFGFVFFHGLILERRKYGPLGWNIPYEFSNSDLSISLAQLKNFLEDYDDIQYAALQYMIAEANYGGRVTDPADRRLIAILFQDICCEDILDDRYCFSGLKEYPVPVDASYKEHEEFINSTIPLNSTPAVFGLHDNADITCAISETSTLFGTALLTLPRQVSSKKGASTEDQVRARAEEILSRLPEKFDVDDVRMKHPNKLEESLNSVLHQELMRYNNLLGIARTSMKNLKDAIDGNAVMTNEIEVMLQSVYDNKTPDAISRVSYPSMMPFSSWINDFLKKIDFLQKWIDNGIPTTFWISAFYFTHSFLTGILQNYARKNKIAIDELGFEFTVMSDLNEYDLTQKPEDGCYIYGFYIEGARWNTESRLLDEPLPKQLLPAMPHVWFRPAKKDINAKIEDYECPVYRTSRRSGELLTTGQSTNFLIHMYLPFDKELYKSEHWVKRGTAILCSLNE